VGRGREVGMNTDVLGLAAFSNPMPMCAGVPHAEENRVSGGS